jgi:sugar O-acyltransferase (sialic acid O-acetyltransferase NeuD family)
VPSAAEAGAEGGLSVTLFGIGSQVVVDVEESCARAGWPIAACVRNASGPAHTAPHRTVTEAGPDTRLDGPVLLPLFSPANRRTAWEDAVSRGARRFPSLIDPTTILPNRIAIEEGVYVNAGCVLGAASRLGRFAFINRGASLGHHLELGEFASIGPGVVIAGSVVIGADCMVGAGAIILPNVRIGAGAVIGAGSVVRRDVPAGAKVLGTAG